MTDEKPERRKNHVIPALGSQLATWEIAADKFSKYSEVRAGPPGRLSEWTRAALNAAAFKLFRVNFTPRAVVPRGRPRYAAELVEQHQFRCTQSEIDTWTACAYAEGLERAEWCRQVLDAAAEDPNLIARLLGAA